MYIKFAVQSPVQTTPNIPKCKNCRWMNSYAKYGARRNQCYCENPYAKVVFKDYDLKGETAFICFTAKDDSEPTIKTSPIWCPLRLRNFQKVVSAM